MRGVVEDAMKVIREHPTGMTIVYAYTPKRTLSSRLAEKE